MDNKDIHRGLIVCPPDEKVWYMGSGNARRRFGSAATDINPSGDWTKYLPKDEIQRNYGFDTMACAVFAPLKAWITLAKFHGFNDFPSDLSERYSGVMCNVTPSGSDPIENCDIISNRYGAVPQLVMPWTEDIDTYFEFFDRRMAKGLIPFGKELISKFELGYQLVWKYEDKDRLSGKEKTDLIRAAMKRGPVIATVSGDYRTRSSSYYKNPGDSDTHILLISRLESSGARIVDDQYDPIIKRFEKDYDHEIAIMFFLARKDKVVDSFYSRIIDMFSKTYSWLKS